MKNILTSSLPAAVTLTAGILLTVSSHAWGSGMSGKADNANQSSQLTPAEQAAFSRLDANGDGKISQSEASKNPILANKFTNVDTDANNVLDEGEFARFEMESQKQTKQK